MPTTPEIWLDEFVANATTTGSQSDPEITQLADGRILVSWTSSDDSGVGSPNSNDIIGQLYDVLGNPIGSEFRLNISFSADNENDHSVAALPDGGFLVVYEDYDGNDVDIRMDRFDSSANHITSVGTIALGTATNDYTNPEIVVSSATSALIVYQNSEGNDDVFFQIYNPTTNTITTAQTVLLAGGTNNRDAQATVLSNGNYAIVAENNGTDNAVYIRVITDTGASVKSFTAVATTATNAQSDVDVDIAALTGGGFVVVWSNTDASDQDVFFQRFNNAGTEVGNATVVVLGSADDLDNEAQVAGLNDGGFVVFWDDDRVGQMQLQRYDANGAKVGSVVTVESFGGTAPDFEVLADGRIMLTWNQGEINSIILDTRDNANTDGVNNVGTIGDDTFTQSSDADAYGWDGNDTITENTFTGDIFGGNGDDTIIVSQAGGFGETFDGEAGTDTLSFLAGSSGVDVNLFTGVISYISGSDDMVAGIENVTGTDGNDTITGNSGANIINGGDGDDILDGGSGNDTVSYASAISGVSVDLNLDGVQQDTGGSGLDTLSDFENIIGSSKADTLTGDAGDNTFAPGFKADIVDGGDGIDTVDYSLSDYAQTINLTSNVNINGHANGDMLTGIENVLGSNTRKDDITGNLLDNLLNGQAGNDVLRGGRGDDTLDGGVGDDVLFGGKGADVLDGGVGRDWAKYNGSSGFVDIDLLSSGTAGIALGDTYISIENVRGTDFGDTILANDLDNKIIAGMGDDIVNGRGGKDALQGNDGNDTIIGGTGNDTMRGQGGDDIFVYTAGDGVDKILDFDDNGDDQIDLSSFGFASFADVQAIMSQSGSRVILDFAGPNTLRLENTNLADMGADDFILTGGAAEAPDAKPMIAEILDTPSRQQDLIAEFMSLTTIQTPVTQSRADGILEIMTDDDMGHDWDLIGAL